MDKRVFLASYKDINKWGERAKNVLDSIEDTDQIILINEGQKLNKPKIDLLDGMKKKSKVYIYEAQDTIQVGETVLLELIRKEPSTNYRVFLIGDTFNGISKGVMVELKKLATSVQHNQTFRVGKIKNQDVEKGEQQTIFSTGTDAVDDALQETMSEMINEMPKEKPKVKQPKKRVHSVERKLASIEKEIFSNTIDIREYNEELSEVQKAKGQLTYELAIRTKGHIERELFHQKETVVLTEDEFYDFVELIMSSDDASMFNDSWSAMHTTLKIKLPQDLFNVFKKEVRYFNAVAELLFKHDAWEGE